jgi:hemerythrin
MTPALKQPPEPSKKPFAVEWREGFSIGIAQLDHEHRHLFSLVLALNLNSVEPTVEKLLDYVVTHFSHEQDAMDRSGYPALEQHLRLHEEFAAKIADFLVMGDGWTEERVQELRRFLNKWLIAHIMTHDMRFGKWLATQNKSR